MGFVVLLVALAVVFFVAMRNFKTVAPSAIEIQKHNKDREARRDVKPEAYGADAASTSQSGDAWNPTPPARPSLETVDQRTNEHSADVQDALSQAN